MPQAPEPIAQTFFSSYGQRATLDHWAILNEEQQQEELVLASQGCKKLARHCTSKPSAHSGAATQGRATEMYGSSQSRSRDTQVSCVVSYVEM